MYHLLGTKSIKYIYYIYSKCISHVQGIFFCTGPLFNTGISIGASLFNEIVHPEINIYWWQRQWRGEDSKSTKHFFQGETAVKPNQIQVKVMVIIILTRGCIDSTMLAKISTVSCKLVLQSQSSRSARIGGNECILILGWTLPLKKSFNLLRLKLLFSMHF